MAETINICDCTPREYDLRSPEEQAETLAKFKALDPRLRIRSVRYLDSQDIRVLRGQPNYNEARSKLPPLTAEQREALAEAHIILTADLPFDMDVLAPDLRWVQAAGAGIAHLQTCGLEKHNVVLTNAAGVASDSIAEFVMGRIIAHWKLFALFEDSQRQKVWKPSYGRNLAGSTIGIVGFGGIGPAIAWRAKAWGMHVLVTRRTLPAEANPTVDRFFPMSALKDMLASADAVVVCAPETPQTYRMFDAAAFAAMKKGSFFVNVARGSLVDETALRQALENGHLGGGAIDVTVTEPLPADNPLWTTPRLAISPHSSTSFDRYQSGVWALFYDNLTRFLAGKPLKNVCSSHLSV